MAASGALVARVEEGSLAEDLGIVSGDVITRMNGYPVEDMIDYRYHLADTEVTLEIRKTDGQTVSVTARKDYDTDLGLGFHTDTFNGLRRCANKCLFCFVDQLPPGVRPTLGIKDDDYRHSFLHGSYISLTNLRPQDWERIEAWRLSPLYVSVHTTNPELRVRLMGNPRAGRILEDLRRLVRAGITVYAQIVLCPGINDGDELDRTLKDLATLCPEVASIAVVPVGLTDFRTSLFPLRSYGRDEAVAVVEQVHRWQESFLKKIGTRLVFLADEFYLLASQPVPEADSYEEFSQLENGVGLIRRFINSFRRTAARLRARADARSEYYIVTGEAAFPVLAALVDEVKSRIPGLASRVVPVRNEFFSSRVTVAGLVTGQDIARQLPGHLQSCRRSPRVVLPEVMLLDGVFLDDMPLVRVQASLGVEVTALPAGGEALARVLLTGGKACG
ncbi:MAG: DUF512 domain-containing protein [Clostridia bacterium]|nr:MAG: DUF512 domain-containing protein [Clostridia bacterium]